MILRARQFEYRFPRPALVMGVLNVTPDSFSDGGRYGDVERAVDHALRMVEEGADWIDVGGESTRPGAGAVSEEEELRRVIPVIGRLRERTGVPLSIDTQKAGVARAALAEGASIVNDIAANREDAAMWEVVAEAQAGYVVMHMQGTPRSMQDQPMYGDVVAEVDEFFHERLRRLEGAGVALERVILDVGIGFGKSLRHNLQLLAAGGSFKKRQRPRLLGVSRKSFIGNLLGVPVERRLPASLACACWSVGSGGAEIIRAHDVAETVQALRMVEAILEERDVCFGPS
jgi:dihydropteroate synthase